MKPIVTDSFIAHSRSYKTYQINAYTDIDEYITKDSGEENVDTIVTYETAEGYPVKKLSSTEYIVLLPTDGEVRLTRGLPPLHFG